MKSRDEIKQRLERAKERLEQLEKLFPVYKVEWYVIDRSRLQAEIDTLEWVLGEV